MQMRINNCFSVTCNSSMLNSNSNSNLYSLWIILNKFKCPFRIYKPRTITWQLEAESHLAMDEEVALQGSFHPKTSQDTWGGRMKHDKLGLKEGMLMDKDHLDISIRATPSYRRHLFQQVLLLEVQTNNSALKEVVSTSNSSWTRIKRAEASHTAVRKSLSQSVLVRFKSSTASLKRSLLKAMSTSSPEKSCLVTKTIRKHSKCSLRVSLPTSTTSTRSSTVQWLFSTQASPRSLFST